MRVSTVILGAGGHAREVLSLLHERGEESVGFLVEPGFGEVGAMVHGLPILGGLEWLDGRRDIKVIVAVGESSLRRRLAAVAVEHGASFTNAVHPNVHAAGRISLGRGVVIAAGSVLTTDIRIGDHVHVNVGCSISHDVTVGDFATLSPGVHLAGGVVVEEGAFLGIGANVLPGVRIGAWSMVGAGAAVTADVPSNATVAGVPAEVLKTREQGWHLVR